MKYRDEFELFMCIIIMLLLGIFIIICSDNRNSVVKANLYKIELKSETGVLINTIYPALGTSIYESDNVPFVDGNNVTYVSESHKSKSGKGRNNYLTASAPIIIITKL